MTYEDRAGIVFRVARFVIRREGFVCIMRAPSLQLVSGLPSEECLERIFEGISVRRSFVSSAPSSWPPEKPVAGYVRGERFCLWKTSPRNSFRRLLEARVRPYRVGTLIEGRFSVHPFSRTFVIVWLGLALLVAVATFIALVILPLLGESSLNSKDVGAFILLLLLLAAGSALCLFTYRAARDEPRFLREFLLELLEARPLGQEGRAVTPTCHTKDGD
ncbi:MAG: hypothetical protein ACYTAS_20915 [Planctomycetota bacterium]